MPYGVISNSLSVLLGGFLGYLLKDRIPERLRVSLPPVLGLVSFVMGLTAIQTVHRLPAVALALISGCVLGELLRLEERLTRLVHRLLGRRAAQDAAQMDTLIGVIVLFCASGTGIYGALESGMTADHGVLFTKSLLDFFTAGLFAALLGSVVCRIALPQFLILLGLFLSAGFILPLTAPEMILDFRACGGAIMLATGFRIAGIKHFSLVNMLPAFVLVMPLSHLWGFSG